MHLTPSTVILAVRHGETDSNLVGRFQGHRDTPLNAAGRRQADRVAHAFRARRDISAVYSSDLARALDTAAPTARLLSMDVRVEPLLRERALGDFEGRLHADVQREQPILFDRWKSREASFKPGGTGESLVELTERTRSAFEALAARHAGGTIVVVTHLLVLDALYRIARGIDHGVESNWRAGNASISTLRFERSCADILTWADSSHLVSDLATERRPAC